MKKVALLLIVVFCMALFTGCNTMKGMGKDIKKLGEKIEDSAD